MVLYSSDALSNDKILIDVLNGSTIGVLNPVLLWLCVGVGAVSSNDEIVINALN
jgi:hypothetical protein